MLRSVLRMRRALLRPLERAQRLSQPLLRCAPAQMLRWRAPGRKPTAQQRSCGGCLRPIVSISHSNNHRCDSVMCEVKSWQPVQNIVLRMLLPCCRQEAQASLALARQEADSALATSQLEAAAQVACIRHEADAQVAAVKVGAAAQAT